MVAPRPEVRLYSARLVRDFYRDTLAADGLEGRVFVSIIGGTWGVVVKCPKGTHLPEVFAKNFDIGAITGDSRGDVVPVRIYYVLQNRKVA